MTSVLAVLEVRDNAVRKGAGELLAAARRIAGASGGRVDALVCGSAAVDVSSLGAAGADRVLTATHADFANYCPEGIVATAASVAGEYDVIVVTASATGKDMAPRLAARIGAPCAMDVTAIEPDGETLRVLRPVYAGKAVQSLELRGRAVLVVRPSAYRASAVGSAGAVVAVNVPAFTRRLVVGGIRQPEKTAIDVAEARVVISGGRGLGEPSKFALLEALAEAFGGEAAVGASRAVVDAGWVPHSAQVGQTGKTVAPDLYIAVGISGAVQHLAGMRTARVIVAINRDKDAPIFRIADYGIVGDLFEVIPALTDAVRKARSH